MNSTQNPSFSRASILIGIQELRFENKTLNPPGPLELQISIKSTGLCGSDLHYYQHYGIGDIKVREPLILGHESAGTVSCLGSEVKGFSIGDRVALEVGLPCAECERCLEGRYNICPYLKFRGSAKAFPHFQGTLQEKINHPAVWCHKLPNHISYDLGAALEPLGVAIHASTRAQLVPEASVLVFGAGTIGLLISAMSKVAGSNNVVIADAQPNRVAFAVENGFAHRGFVVLHTFGQNIHENLQSAKEIGALAILEKPPNEDLISNGYDTVFECTGAELCTQAAIYATRPGGKIVIVGMGNPIQTLPLSAAAHREIDIVGTFRYANTYPRAIEFVAGNQDLIPPVEKIITHSFHGVDSVPQALDMAARTTDEAGKLVLKVVVRMNDGGVDD